MLRGNGAAGARAREAEADGDMPGAYHGSTGDPVSRALLVLGDPPSYMPSDAPICQEARRMCGEPGQGATWQQVVPPAEALLADPAFDERKGYLEYRKYFRTGAGELHLNGLAAAANPVFAGLNLVAAEAGLPDWPAAQLSASAAEHTLGYRYTAHHVGETWATSGSSPGTTGTRTARCTGTRWSQPRS